MGKQRREGNAGRVAARLARHVEVALGRIDLTTSQYRMLVQLGEGPEVSSSLARKLAVRPPSVTNVVDGLVQRDLVVRTHSAVDRRQISLALTPEGHALLARADGAVREQLLDVLSTTRDEALLDSLAAWRPALDAHRARRREASNRATQGSATARGVAP